MELRDYLRILRKRWKEVFFIFLIVLSCYYSYLRVGRKQPFKSTILAHILKSPAEAGLVYAENAPQIPISSFEAKVRLFTSMAVCKVAAKKITEDGTPIEAEDVRNAISVTAMPDEQGVLLTAVHEHPEVAMRICERVLEAMKARDKEDMESYYANQKAALQHLMDQRVEDRKKLDDDYAALNDELERSGLYFPEEQVGAQLGLMGNLAQSKVRLELDLRRLEAEKKAGAPGGLPLPPRFPEGQAPPIPPTQTDQVVSSLRDRLVGILADLASLKSRYTDAHPKVIELESKRKAIEMAIKEAATKRPGPTETSRIDAEIAVTKNEVAFLDEAMQEKGKDLVALSEKREQYRGMTSERGRLVEAIDALKRQITQVEFQSKGIQSYITWDQSDLKPGEPFGRTGFESLPFAGMVALVLGIMGGYMLEYLNNTLRTSQDVKVYLSLPTIATMPLFPTERPSLLNVSPQTPEWELFNRLSTLLEAIALEQRARTFLFTSVKPDEGKSTLAANTAVALAQGGERVILVDCDLRQPTCHSFFGVENTRGVSTILAGDREGTPMTLFEPCLQTTPIDSLKVITSGPIPSNPVSLLKSPRMGWLLSELKKSGALVIFDSPPILELTDPAILGAQLDVTVLVMAENYVTRREGVQAKHVLTQVGANIAGVILNKGTHEPAEYYYYRYSRYARYGRARRGA